MNIIRHFGNVHSIRRLGPCGLLAAIAAATTLAIASPSQASSNARISGGITFSNAGFFIRIGNAGDNRVSFKQREFQRGLAEGRCDGACEGFRDGFDGRCFEDHPRVRFNDASCNFVEGYKDGYAAAYACAFKEGKQARCERDSNRGCERDGNRGSEHGNNRGGNSHGHRWR